MAPKRKSMATEETETSSKRQKINSESTNYPCQLCISSEANDVITARVTTKGKPTQGVMAHKRCMDIHPELECDGNKWKILPANLSSYKARFKLVRIYIGAYSWHRLTSTSEMWCLPKNARRKDSMHSGKVHAVIPHRLRHPFFGSPVRHGDLHLWDTPLDTSLQETQP